MKFIFLFLLTVISSQSFANIDITKDCIHSAELALFKKLDMVIEVFSIVEVGPGTNAVDHVIIFGDKNSGGTLFKAVAKANSMKCNFEINSVDRIY